VIENAFIFNAYLVSEGWLLFPILTTNRKLPYKHCKNYKILPGKQEIKQNPLHGPQNSDQGGMCLRVLLTRHHYKACLLKWPTELFMILELLMKVSILWSLTWCLWKAKQN
jgi:hypothetical protein